MAKATTTNNSPQSVQMDVTDKELDKAVAAILPDRASIGEKN